LLAARPDNNPDEISFALGRRERRRRRRRKKRGEKRDARRKVVTKERDYSSFAAADTSSDLGRVNEFSIRHGRSRGRR